MFLMGRAFPGRMSASGPLTTVLPTSLPAGARRVRFSPSGLGDAAGHARRVALEVDDAVVALVAAAAPAHGNVAVVVAPRDALLRLQQTLLGLGARRQLVARPARLGPARRRCRCQFLDA